MDHDEVLVGLVRREVTRTVPAGRLLVELGELARSPIDIKCGDAPCLLHPPNRGVCRSTKRKKGRILSLGRKTDFVSLPELGLNR